MQLAPILSNGDQYFPNAQDIKGENDCTNHNLHRFNGNQFRVQETNMNFQPSIKQESDAVNQISNPWKTRQICTNINQTPLSSIAITETSCSNNYSRAGFNFSKQSSSPELTPPYPLPTIGEVLESSGNRSSLTSKSLSQTNFEKTFGVQAPRVENQENTKRNDSVRNTFKRSKSFHSLSGINALPNLVQGEWPKKTPQEQFKNINNNLTKTESGPTFESLSPLKQTKVSNDFSTILSPQINTIINSKDFTRSLSNSRPNDHTASDSGLSMDEHLDWMNDSSLFDF